MKNYKKSRHNITPREKLIILYVSSIQNRSCAHVRNVLFGSKNSIPISQAIQEAAKLSDEELKGGAIPSPERGSTPSGRPGEVKGVQCKCPKCGIIYTRDIYWTGRGMPKIYCPPCRQMLFETEPEEGQLQKIKHQFRNWVW